VLREIVEESGGANFRPHRHPTRVSDGRAADRHSTHCARFASGQSDEGGGPITDSLTMTQPWPLVRVYVQAVAEEAGAFVLSACKHDFNPERLS
jgi:hypothetical protein